MTEKTKNKQLILTAAGLLVLTIVAYAGVRNHAFINFDDDTYVTENTIVAKGLTFEGLSWALGFNERGYWQPLTWLSHMLDCELFGLDPTGHHLTNLVLHLVNSLLLFGALYKMTGSLYRCAFVAAVFALHPLNVDSVAWVAERKNLLSTSFWMLSLVAYNRYAAHPRLNRYLLTLSLFALGLMTKPMLVTLPFVLLLLDYWPLARLNLGQLPKSRRTGRVPATAIGLFIEKIPFFVLSIVSVGLSILSTQHINNMVPAERVPMTLRISNALVSYVSYIKKMFDPSDLAVFYPYPESIPVWQAATAAILLTMLTAVFLSLIKRKAFLAVGWFWYLGTMLPVIGILQGGVWPEMADRWAYIPLIGLFVMMAWTVPERLYGRPLARAVLVTAVLAVIGSLFFATQKQVQHWQSSRTLFEQALKVTPPNFVTHNNLGDALLSEGEIEAALKHFRAAVKLEPQKSSAYNNMGNALMKLGLVEEAIDNYSQSLKLNSAKAKTHNNLAVALNKQDRLTESIQHLQTALRLEPDYADAYNNLGAIYRQKGQIQNAAKCYLAAIRLKPVFAQPYNNLGLLLWHEKKLTAAIYYFQQALKQNPEFTAAENNLNQARAELDAFEQTVAGLKKKLSRNPDDVDLRVVLGDLYKVHNRLDEAVKQYQLGLASRPNSIAIQSRMAIVHAMKGQYDEAIDLLKVLLQQHPDNINLHYNLASIYSRNNQLKDSIYWLKMAIAKGFDNWDQIKIDRNFDNLKSTSFFQALADRK